MNHLVLLTDVEPEDQWFHMALTGWVLCWVGADNVSLHFYLPVHNVMVFGIVGGWLLEVTQFRQGHGVESLN